MFKGSMLLNGFYTESFLIEKLSVVKLYIKPITVFFRVQMLPYC